MARQEKGVHVLSLTLLRRLLAACGMLLELALTPQPGLIDAPVRELLDKPPSDRLRPDHLQVLTTLAPVLLGLGLPVLVADRCAARLGGALVKVFEVELWVDEAVDTVTQRGAPARMTDTTPPSASNQPSNSPGPRHQNRRPQPPDLRPAQSTRTGGVSVPSR